MALVGPLLRGRLPSENAASSHKIEFGILKEPFFIALAFSNLFQGSGLFHTEHLPAM
jgi:hypothetical protein